MLGRNLIARPLTLALERKDDRTNLQIIRVNQQRRECSTVDTCPVGYAIAIFLNLRSFQVLRLDPGTPHTRHSYSALLPSGFAATTTRR